ncbi:Gmad2 immunoglobulin-like domain-containing protein [Roseivirga sp. BDSF3-8]|uniref:Gmad2 immunoglobulin-like domain-containing protein n=1 Tax=Roseivirga sp. BDSF3-8 TaxID=3241598 RepID=UPI00353278FB
MIYYYRKTILSFTQLISLAILSTLISCGENSGKKDDTPSTKDSPTSEQPVATDPTDKVEPEPYHNEAYVISLDLPNGWTALENISGSPVPVINIYKKDTGAEPPIHLHAGPEVSHVSFYPEGYGTELPHSQQERLLDKALPFPSPFDVNKGRSIRFLLQNGEAWAYLLRPQSPPSGWTEEGFIMIKYSLENFKTTCYEATSDETKPMDTCDPMGGDSVVYSGSVVEASRREVAAVMQSLSLSESDNSRPHIGDLIKIDQPLPNLDVQSPIEIKGEARGQWYNEGSFMVRLEDKDGNILADTLARAEGQWMTKEFVPFSTRISFESPGNERGYLVFERANPSGLKENARSFRLPVIFSTPKE